MSGIFYRECGAQAGATENDAMTRLRSDQMLRAVRVAAGFGPRWQGARTGQILDDDEPGGDGARIIDAQRLR